MHRSNFSNDILLSKYPYLISIRFWVMKLTDKDLNPPKVKYIKCLLEKGWKKKFKITKFFQCVAKRPVHYLSTVALKSMYVIHSYFLYGPLETLSINEFNFEEYLGFFINLWNQRAETSNYDEDVRKMNKILGFASKSQHFKVYLRVRRIHTKEARFPQEVFIPRK